MMRATEPLAHQLLILSRGVVRRLTCAHRERHHMPRLLLVIGLERCGVPWRGGNADL